MGLEAARYAESNSGPAACQGAEGLYDRILRMGPKGLAGAAAAGTLAAGGGGAPSWLIWAAVILLGAALLIYAASRLLAFAEYVLDWRRARRRAKHYREAQQACERRSKR